MIYNIISWLKELKKILLILTNTINLNLMLKKLLKMIYLIIKSC
jgi:hypothetical protein